MLTGAELLNRVKELGDCAKTDLAKGCGYVVKKKDGSEQVKFTAFYEALLELQPGDEYEIKLGRKQIRLIPVGGSEEED